MVWASFVFAQQGGVVNVVLSTIDTNPVTTTPLKVNINFSEPVKGFNPALNKPHIIISHPTYSQDNLSLKWSWAVPDVSGVLEITFSSDPNIQDSRFGEYKIVIPADITSSVYLDKPNAQSNELKIDYQPNCDNENMSESEFCIEFSESIGQNKVIRSDTGLGLFGDYVVMIYQYAASIIGVISVLVLVVGGVMIIMGGASTETVNTAKGIIGKALVSLVLLFLVGLILKTINPAFYTTHECEDGIDNDEDGLSDERDEGCKGYVPGSADFTYYEAKADGFECSNNKDDDGDGLVDADDPGCYYPATSFNPRQGSESRCTQEQQLFQAAEQDKAAAQDALDVCIASTVAGYARGKCPFEEARVAQTNQFFIGAKGELEDCQDQS